MNENVLYKNLLFLDIETISLVDRYEKLPDRLKALWNHKAQFIKNDLSLSPEELFFDKAAIYSEFGKVVCISVGFFNRMENGEYQLRVTSFYGDDEKKILSDFKSLLEKLDQKELRLVAHNGKEFDFPYICRRMIINEIGLPYCLQLAEKKPWEVKHIDTMEMWKFGDKKSYTSLELLATIFDITSSKQEIDGSMVNQTYYVDNNCDLISEYCQADVIVTAQLYLRMNLLPLIKEENIVSV